MATFARAPFLWVMSRLTMPFVFFTLSRSTEIDLSLDNNSPIKRLELAACLQENPKCPYLIILGRHKNIPPVFVTNLIVNAVSTEMYFDHINTPLVIFIKTQFVKMIFIVLHCRICILGSSVLPVVEEYLVFVFFMAVTLSEYEQWRSSEPKIRKKIYFR